jgi:hypothetical protein
MSGRISTIFSRPGILQEPAKEVLKVEGLRFGVRARGRCRKRRAGICLDEEFGVVDQLLD